MGGVEKKIIDYPHVVSLQLDGHHFCVGTIITKKFILTACHCVKDKYYLHNFKILVQGPNVSYTYLINSIHRHPEFSINKLENMLHNVAIINLTNSISEDLKVKPIQLFDEEDNEENEFGSAATLTGMSQIKNTGKTQPKSLRVSKIFSKNKCNELYKHLFILSDDQFCAGEINSKEGPCLSDSGAPLLVKNRQIGILSGYPEAKKECNDFFEIPPIYASVAAHRSWINEIVPELKKIKKVEDNAWIYYIIGAVIGLLVVMILVMVGISRYKKRSDRQT